MNWFIRIYRATLGRRRGLYNDLAEEMRQHLDERTEQLMREGLPRADAESAARRAFGNPTLIEQRSREVWQWPLLESFWADTKYAFRQLRKAPGFAAVAIATLALGIGVNTAIFAVFDQVLLKAMPVHQPQRLVLLSEHSRYETGTLNIYAGNQYLSFSYPAYQALRKNTVLSSLAVSALAPVTIASPTRAENTWIQFVSGNYFKVMDLRPVRGRLLTPADDQLHAANPVAVLSETYWRAHLGADPGILNSTLLLNGSPVTIVGIVRHIGIYKANPVAIFMPVTTQGRFVPVQGDPLIDPLNCWLDLVGRLAPGVTRAKADTQLNLLWWNWRRDTLNLKKHSIPDQKGWLQTHLSVTSGAKGISLLEDNFRQPVKILQAMALFVLLIVCGNIANLLLAKAAFRHSGLAMRAALGAGRRRIFQQVIVEGLLLGVLGAIGGLLLGWLTLKLLLHVTPDSDVLHFALATRMDWQIIGISIAAGIVTSFVFGLVPAVLGTRIDILRSLHGQTGAISASAGGLRSLLVALQIALSVGLLTCATVFAYNLYSLRSINPGFATTRVINFTVDAAQEGNIPTQANQEYTRIAADLRHLPGVQRVAYARNGFLSGDESGGNVTVRGRANNYHDPLPLHNIVSPGFFSAMQVPLLAGREFTSTDTQSGHRAAIVDQAFVNYYFHGDTQKALSSALTFNRGTPDIPIVGVIPTIRVTNLAVDPWVPCVYEPWNTNPHIGTHVHQFPAVFYIRTARDPANLADPVRALVHRVDPGLPVERLQTMREHIDHLTFDSQLVTILSVAMGTLALLLAAIGLYGVLAFSVSRRTAEIGIRMALGADRRAVVWLFCRQILWLVLAGALAGSALGWLGIKTLVSRDGNIIVKMDRLPPWIFGVTGAVLLLAMLFASLIPALRAASIDPTQALRAE